MGEIKPNISTIFQIDESGKSTPAFTMSPPAIDDVDISCEEFDKSVQMVLEALNYHAKFVHFRPMYTLPYSIMENERVIVVKSSSSGCETMGIEHATYKEEILLARWSKNWEHWYNVKEDSEDCFCMPFEWMPVGITNPHNNRHYVAQTQENKPIDEIIRACSDFRDSILNDHLEICDNDYINMILNLFDAVVGKTLDKHDITKGKG